MESAYSKDFILQNISNVSMIIAGSNAVKENLINRYGADPKKVKAIHSFVDEKLVIHKDKTQLKKNSTSPNLILLLVLQVLRN
jgi:hypothetical protein